MISPQDLMALAERLASIGTEVEGRAAVGRAYYGAFHQARSLLEYDCGVAFQRSDAGIHKKVCQCLEQSTSSELKDIAKRLDTLRAERNHADYDLADSRFAKKSNVQAQLTIAKAIVDETIAALARVAEFKTAVRQYASGVLKLGLR